MQSFISITQTLFVVIEQLHEMIYVDLMQCIDIVCARVTYSIDGYRRPEHQRHPLAERHQAESTRQ